MYLYVYIFLLLAVIGMYSQLFVARMARINNNVTAVAEVMYRWHNGAYKTAKDNVSSLFPSAPPVATSICFLSRDINNYPNGYQAPLGHHSCLSLMSATTYKMSLTVPFTSIAYRVGSVAYVATFIVPVNSVYANLGYTYMELAKQIRESKAEKMNTGRAAAQTCGTQTHGFFTLARDPGTNQPYCYPTSDTATGRTYVPDGAVGFVSQL